MHLSIDWWASLILFLTLILLTLIKKKFGAKNQIPTTAFSQVKKFENCPSNWRVRLISLPKWLYTSALIFFLLAFIDPHFVIKKDFSNQNKKNVTIPTEGIALYLVLDQSGSMSQKVLTQSTEGNRVSMPKIDLLKKFTMPFIQEHADDLIGLTAFARVPRVLVPLTLDQPLLIDELQKIQVVTNSNDDGTALGYALFKAANLITATRHYASELNQQQKNQYDIKSAVIVAVTDGMQNPSYLDKGNRLRTMELDEAANYAKSQNIRLYIVNIDPTFATEEFAPHRRQLQTITQLTGGQFYLADDTQSLQQIYNHINALEKGKIPQFVLPIVSMRYFSFYPYLIFVGLICFLAACFLDSIFFRKVP
jgi:Ca-activated chloride channel family protein